MAVSISRVILLKPASIISPSGIRDIKNLIRLLGEQDAIEQVNGYLKEYSRHHGGGHTPIGDWKKPYYISICGSNDGKGREIGAVITKKFFDSSKNDHVPFSDIEIQTMQSHFFVLLNTKTGKITECRTFELGKTLSHYEAVVGFNTRECKHPAGLSREDLMYYQKLGGYVLLEVQV